MMTASALYPKFKALSKDRIATCERNLVLQVSRHNMHNSREIWLSLKKWLLPHSGSKDEHRS